MIEKSLVWMISAAISSFSPLTGTATQTQAQAEEPSETRAHVSVTLRAGEQAIQVPARVLEWGTQTHWSIEDGEHEHRIAVSVRRIDAEQVAIRLAYSRDGATMVEVQDAKGRIAAPKEFQSTDGTLAVGLVVAEAAARIELPDGDDPLAGV